MKKRHFTAPSGARLSFTELGFGAAPLGNLYRALTEDEAQATLSAAWRAGIRYFDTAPLYGLGLSETRLNHFLRGRKRSDYVISTKVGRLLAPCAPSQRTGIGKFFDVPARREVYDYSYDGIMRSIDFSLERLGLDAIDILYVHDIDLVIHKSEAVRDAHVETLMTGGYKALARLREQKVVKAIGTGLNEWRTGELLLQRGDFDLFLLAGRYTLLEQEALTSFLPLCERRGVGIVLGGPYNSGILATGANKGAMYEYNPAPRAVRDKVRAIAAVCARHKVKLAQAALRFPLLHPSVVSVIPGAASPREVAQNAGTLGGRLPRALWRDLKAQGLMREEAPT